jgi:squalene-hopene/tetraprenyl-beta-curcumene cyclase
LQAGILLVAGLPALVGQTGRNGDWNPRLAADYLDGREKAWFAWPAAKAAGGTCVSCHTGMTYILARPALRKVLGERQPTEYETAILAGLQERTVKDERMFGGASFAKEPKASQAAGVQSILAALLLARSDRSPKMNPATEQAFDRMWAAQIHDGPAKGSWPWFALDLDPWETQDSALYGAALAAVAVGAAPTSYRETPAVKAHIDEVAAYLRTAQAGQPLHNRLMLLWVAAALPDALPQADGARLVAEVLAKQQPDGVWTMDSLGPWKDHPAALASTGSNSYATAVAAVALEQVGLNLSNAGLSKALRWLRSHQDPAGYWDATSMNKRFNAGSMQELFMRDAATAFAAWALADAELRNRDMASLIR